MSEIVIGAICGTVVVALHVVSRVIEVWIRAHYRWRNGLPAAKPQGGESDQE